MQLFEQLNGKDQKVDKDKQNNRFCIQNRPKIKPKMF